MKTYAEIKNGIIIALGTCDDDFTPESDGTIAFVFLDGLEPQPEAGWSFDGASFSPPPPPDQSSLEMLYILAVQGYLDRTAHERGYDGILSLCSYATSSNSQFSAEGQAGVNWRDAVWGACYQLLAAVESGSSVPEISDFISTLPSIVWPEAVS